jgi:hypothetical protein
LVRLRWRAAASKARKALSGGIAYMRISHLKSENISFVAAKLKAHIQRQEKDE